MEKGFNLVVCGFISTFYLFIIKTYTAENIEKKFMKFKVFIILLIFGAMFFLSKTSVLASEGVILHVFYGQGCPHCAALLSFLDKNKANYPTLKIYEHEVYQNDTNRKLFEELTAKFNTTIEGVPTVFIDDKVIVGFSQEIAVSLETEIDRCLYKKCGDPIEKKSVDVEKVIDRSSTSSEKNEAVKKLTIPLVIGAAAVDAINPCAFAVLIILMTVALSIADKKCALKFGLAFTISIYISYFLMGLGLFSVLQASGLSHKFYIFVTILAVVVGLLNIKDYFWYGKGFLMEIPLSWRPTMKSIIKRATSPLGAFLVGFAVSCFELPCTGGPYIVILGLLAKEVTRTTGIAYLFLYNLVFVTPLVILSITIYKGLATTEKLESIRQDKIKVLHLIAGILMLIIAVAMILSIIHGQI